MSFICVDIYIHVHVCTRINLYALYRIMGTSIAIVILNNYYYCVTIETCCYTTDDSETCGSSFEKLKDTVISKCVPILLCMPLSCDGSHSNCNNRNAEGMYL